MISVFVKTKFLLAPVSGRVVSWSKDEKNRKVGIIPSDVKLFAPVSGVVTVKETGGAAEVFVDPFRGHIELSGSFTGHIKNGSRVKAGDLIAAIDLDGGSLTKVSLIVPQKFAAVQIDAEWLSGGASRIMRAN